jgi:RNA polymerase sigma-70 factor (ECF subfamily)
MGPDMADDHGFGVLVAALEQRLRRALVGAYGRDVGREATADALAWAWEHRERLARVDNVAGYLYRVGQTSARRQRRRPAAAPYGGDGERNGPAGDAWVEPGLDRALAGLTEHQRVAVVLCHGFAWTHREVAELLGVSPSTVQNHVERGLAKLRAGLGGDRYERSG